MKHPLRWGIRAKMMAFAVLLCAVMVALVALLNVQLLEPSYNKRILSELNATADIYAQLIERYGVIEDETQNNGVNPEFYAAINSLDNDTLLSGKCLDISGAAGLNLLHAHYLTGECKLHAAQPSFLGDKRDVLWNGRYVVGLRSLVQLQGDMQFTIDENGISQMVVCRLVANNYVIIISTDLERIGQAAKVIYGQLPLIAVLVLSVGLVFAYLYSSFFARPITELSHAAREVAKGNYRVRVEKRSADEIGMLAEDFNVMAREIGRTNELQRDLIANISHDLRTPLTLIKGYAETVRDLTGDQPAKRTKQLDVIVDETDRLSGLVNSVMELSKYSSGTEKLQLITFDLAQLCEEVAGRYSDICAKNGYTLRLETDTPCPVTADPEMMTRVVHNLLANAVHHIGEDRIILLRAVPENGQIRVEVEDHGAGIAEEDLPYIFDKYYRSRADAGKVGTGLGLSITKAILINHGFAFGVRSTLGKGSTFWFLAR